MRPRLKYLIGGFVLCALALAMLFLFWPQHEPPLPFNTNVFVSSQPLNLLVVSPHAPLKDRLSSFVLGLEQKIQRQRGWSFSASPVGNWGVQPLLNNCMDVSGTRYLMPAQIAGGIVQFGHSNALDGPQMIAAVESALQKSDTGWWDAKAKKWRAEPLQLLRFPAQKTVVLLPKSEVADFLRTNGIDARRFGKALD